MGADRLLGSRTLSAPDSDYLVTLVHRQDGDHWARKRVRPGRAEAHLEARLGKEAAVLRLCAGGPGIPKLLGFTESPATVVTPFFAGGSLLGRITAALPEGLSPHTVVPIGLSMVDSLDFLHGQGVVHRDVKPANLLFDSEDTTYLVDFGVAVWGDPPRALPDDWRETEAGTPGYAPPELLEDPETAFSPAVDVYGLSASLFTCLAGRTAFETRPGEPLQTLARRLRRTGTGAMRWPSGVPAPLRRLLTAGLAPDSGARPDLAAFRTVLAPLV